MSRFWVAVIAGASGIGIGLLIAKAYAHAQVQGAVDAGLGEIGLGGGKVQAFADRYLVPSIA